MGSAASVATVNYEAICAEVFDLRCNNEATLSFSELSSALQKYVEESNLSPNARAEVDGGLQTLRNLLLAQEADVGQMINKNEFLSILRSVEGLRGQLTEEEKCNDAWAKVFMVRDAGKRWVGYFNLRTAAVQLDYPPEGDSVHEHEILLKAGEAGSPMTHHIWRRVHTKLRALRFKGDWHLLTTTAEDEEGAGWNYWYNSITGETRWEDEEGDNENEVAEDVYYDEDGNVIDYKQYDTPWGRIDDSDGKVLYYYNYATAETSHTKPNDLLVFEMSIDKELQELRALEEELLSSRLEFEKNQAREAAQELALDAQTRGAIQNAENNPERIPTVTEAVKQDMLVETDNYREMKKNEDDVLRKQRRKIKGRLQKRKAFLERKKERHMSSDRVIAPSMLRRP